MSVCRDVERGLKTMNISFQKKIIKENSPTSQRHERWSLGLDLLLDPVLKSSPRSVSRVQLNILEYTYCGGQSRVSAFKLDNEDFIP